MARVRQEPRQGMEPVEVSDREAILALQREVEELTVTLEVTSEKLRDRVVSELQLEIENDVDKQLRNNPSLADEIEDLKQDLVEARKVIEDLRGQL